MLGDELQEALESYGVPEWVIEEYGIAAERVERIGSVLKIEGNSRAVALKKTQISEARLKYAIALADFLRTSGLSSPSFLQNRYGDSFVVDEQSVYYVTDWKSGRPLRMRNSSDIVKAASWLGEWHRAASRYTPESPLDVEPPSLEVRLLRGISDFSQFYRELKEKESATPFQTELKLDLPGLLDRIERTLFRLQELEFTEYQQTESAHRSHCHGRFLGQNLIESDEGSWTLVNYDNIYYGSALYELSLFIQRYAPNVAWRQQVIENAIQAYQEASQVSFDGEDEERLVALLMAPLRTMQVITWYAQGVKDWTEDEYREVYQGAVEADSLRERLLSKGLIIRSEDQVVVAKQKIESVLAPEHPVASQDDTVRPEHVVRRSRKRRSPAARRATVQKSRNGSKIQLPPGDLQIVSGIKPRRSSRKREIQTQKQTVVSPGVTLLGDQSGQSDD